MSLFIIRLSLACSLLTSERMPTVAEFAFVQPHLEFVSRAIEIMGDNEGLSSKHPIENQLQTLRRDYVELTQAPLSSAGHIFLYLDSVTVQEAMRLNREHQRRLEVIAQLHPGRNSISVEQDITRELYRAWDALDDAKRCSFSIGYRRRGLARLREMLGDDAFQRGEMPFPLPRGESWE